jgi:acetoacetyl-CoA reductase/3-oxoacyl-[acyl-carrier protein] reductase
MKRLEGKIAFVTGGSRGIGRASALALAAEGAKVAVCYHTQEAAAVAVQKEIISQGGEALTVQADIAVSAQIRAAIQHVIAQWGRIDILVNDAAITHDKTLRKMTDEEWHEVINTDLNGVFFAMSAVIPSMIENKFGRIINISSYTGHYGNFGQANYGAAKAGIIGLTKTAALELARYNITVNAICPGYTETDMMATIPANIREQLTGKIPVGRFADPAEIAWGVVFLAADTGFVTGQEIGINGGMGM